MRLLIQVPLSLGTLIMVPFASPFLIAPIFPSYWLSLWSAIIHSELKKLYVGLILPAGAFGLIGLWLSIMLSESFMWGHDRIRRTVMASLVAGALTAVSFLFWVLPAHVAAHDYSRLLADAWIYLGALIVACWNLLRYGKKPNHFPLPTLRAAD